MNTLTIDNIEYVLSDYILKNAPIYSKGSRSTRDLMKRKKISENDYVYMKIKDDKYTKSNGKSNRDKIFVKKSIIDIIPELNNKKGITDDGIEEAPEIIKLKDSEKFFDNKGKPLEIETRGERTEEGIYFKVKDVEKAFGIERLQDVLIDIRSKNFQENIDYKYFICKKTTKIKKLLFLTYHGFLNVLFSLRPQYLNKENNICNIITENIKLNWEKNKQIKNYKYRPDLITTFDNKTLIIEIDENQHKYYDKELDEERSNILKNKFKNMIILRINPDCYINKHGNNIIGIVDDNNEFSNRMQIILNTINDIINNKSEQKKEIKLFFDKYVQPTINIEKKFKYIDCLKKNKVDRNIFFKQITKLIKSNTCRISGEQPCYIQRELILVQKISDLELELVKAERDVAVKDKKIAELKLLLEKK